MQTHKRSKLDANWIPIIVDEDGRLADNWLASVRRYWCGEEVPGTVPVWETIVSGCVTIWGTDLKDRALKEIKRYFPDTEPAWTYSEVCFDVGSLDGIYVPVAVNDGESLVVLGRFQKEDGNDHSFREKLRRGASGSTRRLRNFSDFDSIQWPKLELNEPRISLSELGVILRDAGVT